MYTYWETYVSISNPQDVVITKDSITFSGCDQVHTFLWKDIKSFRCKEFYSAKKIFLRINRTSLTKGRYWIACAQFNDSDELFQFLLDKEYELHPTAMKAVARRTNEDSFKQRQEAQREKEEAERKAKAEAEAKALELERLKAEEAARLKVFEEAAKAKALREEEARAKALAEEAAKAQAIEDEKARKAAEFQAQLEAKMKAFEAALAKADKIEAETKTHHGKHIETEKVEIEVKTTRRVKKNKN